ncbi:MAG: sensor histidine kinase [Lachnospiraceae bacterium]|jgi:hypothetical protein|nr:sensor histidine kinase [Lachnospiraceae bacterium]MCR4802067.1 ATP-binding protein [Lachnospiraceae bacterium]
MSRKEIIETLYNLCRDNETFADAFSQFCHEIDDELEKLGSLLRNELTVQSADDEPTYEHLKDVVLANEPKDDTDLLDEIYGHYEAIKAYLQVSNEYINMISICDTIGKHYEKFGKTCDINFVYEKKIDDPGIFQNYFCNKENFQNMLISLLKNAFHRITEVSEIKLILNNPAPGKGQIVIEHNGNTISVSDLCELNQNHISENNYYRNLGIWQAKRFAEEHDWDFSFSSGANETITTLTF